MPLDRFLIAPLNNGLEADLRPWQIMDDSFILLKNLYSFRGRIKKRSGSLLMDSNPLNSRLRINIGTVSSHTIPGNASQLQIGQIFSVGEDIFTITALGAGVLTLSTNTGATATINSTTNPNTVTFTGEPGASIVYYYPAEPVMGITQYESGAINNHPTYAFDEQFAYLFTPGSGWGRSEPALWHGNNDDYFWATNWQGVAGNPVLFVTNFNATVPTPAATDDPIWSFDGTTWTSRSGANGFYFLPAGGAIHTGPFVQTSRIIVPFKNRLVLLYTIENDGGMGGGTNTAYVNRARYSFNGSPFAANAWYEPNQTDSSGNIAAGAGYIDAATEEQIVTAEFIKDRLIVGFERSTWELAYTGNEIQPFIWQKLNTELGSQSTFSAVPFDKEILNIGQTGVHQCNGSNVARIDENIPDVIFSFKNDQTLRTCGIRDYFNELVYWSYLDVNAPTTSTFPNQLLVYNYRNKSFSKYDDCFTTFGYFEQQQDTTWASSAPQTWEQFNGTWESGVLAANQRQILGGTPEGFVLRINDDTSRNAPSMQITNATQTGNIVTLTIIEHNLDAMPTDDQYDQDFIYIENIGGDTPTILALDSQIFEVDSVVDANTITINVGNNIIGDYLGGGTCARVSNMELKTKQFNPYDKDDRNVFIERVNFFVEKTAAGELTVDYLPSSTDISMIEDATANASILGSSVLQTHPLPSTYNIIGNNMVPAGLEFFQSRLNHPVYFQTNGTSIQLYMYLTPQQMKTPSIAFSDFELQGMILHAMATDSRLQ